MLTTEFIKNFAEKYSVQKIDDIKSGIIITPIKDDIYLIEHTEVKQTCTK